MSVKMFAFAKRQNANRVGSIHQNIVNKVGGHGKAIKHKDLDIRQDLYPAEMGEDAA